MPRFSFLHAADIHLDSGFAGMAARDDGAAADAASHATRRAFTRLIDTAIEEGVAFVLIAGDLYDGAPKDVELGHFVRREAGRLERAGIGLFIIKGNHDSASTVADSHPVPPNTTIFSSHTTETHLIPELGVAIHGRSFPKRHIDEDLSLAYPAPVPDHFNIGMLHTSAGGYADHEVYAPCSPEALARKGYDYWALGHVHEAATLVEDPPVRFSGCLQGRSIRETGPKGAWLVETDGQAQTARFLPLDVARWHRARCDLSGAESESDVETRVREALIAVQEDAEGLPVFVRLDLAGDTGMDPWLRQKGQSGLTEWCMAIAATLESVHLEKVRLHTASPVAEDPVTIAPLVDALRLACEDPGIHADIEAMIREVREKRPGTAEIEIAPEGIASVIADARRLLLASEDREGGA